MGLGSARAGHVALHWLGSQDWLRIHSLEVCIAGKRGASNRCWTAKVSSGLTDMAALLVVGLGHGGMPWRGRCFGMPNKH